MGLCVLAGSPALAQVAVDPQPDVAALAKTWQAARDQGKLGSAELLALKPGQVDAGLARDLIDKDWLDLGAWSYPEAKFGVGYAQNPACQHDILRYQSDGGELHFSLGDLCTSPTQAKLTHTNFQLPPPVKVAVQGKGGDTWLAIDAWGKREFQRVVAYRAGVLVVDITYTGKKTDRKVKFRAVRIAVPRTFVATLPGK